MSTFRGIVAQFPRIRIDYFRTNPDHPPPLACFLSHVHSDHLQGLESLKSPFVYCSSATREILLRLEKYPHRMNFAKGVLESRVQTYRHLKTLLKPIPLETPTIIELAPGEEIRVTLFDANHCVGAVMFLIEAQGKAILYTGDIRAEPWWIDQLCRNPILLPYATGLKTLDQLYLDTTFATRSDRDYQFPSKAEGIREMLEKVRDYPDDTVFYVESWTFGYEPVWIALSNYIGSKVHLDRYRWSIYKSLGISKDLPLCPEAAALLGFSLGNHTMRGCLTSDSNVRIHSCERGNFCAIWSTARQPVRIVPIISRLNDGSEVHELGIGGGKGDLDQIHELEVADEQTSTRLLQECLLRLKSESSEPRLALLLRSLLKRAREGVTLRLDAGFAMHADQPDVITLDALAVHLIRLAQQTDKTKIATRDEALSDTITFPYSRHSSYEELCMFVSALRPRDVYPCTVDESSWKASLSMRSLFGRYCSGDIFAHDEQMLSNAAEHHEPTGKAYGHAIAEQDLQFACQYRTDMCHRAGNRLEGLRPMHMPADPRTKVVVNAQESPLTATDERGAPSPHPPPLRTGGKAVIREWAYKSAAGFGNDTWALFGGLQCVRSIDKEELLGSRDRGVG